MIKVIKIHKDNYESWQYIPLLLERIAKFTTITDSETDPKDLADLVRMWFALGDQRLWLCIGVNEHNDIVAHTLCTPEPFAHEKWRYVLIRQAQVDPGVYMPNEMRFVWDHLVEWTKSLGLKKIIAATHRNEKAMERAWKMKKYKTLMKYDIEDT